MRSRKHAIIAQRCDGPGCLALVHGYATLCERCSGGQLWLPARRSAPASAWAAAVAIVLVLLGLATLASTGREERVTSEVLQ